MNVPLGQVELDLLTEFVYTGRLYLSVGNIDKYLKISSAFGGMKVIEAKMISFLCECANENGNYFQILSLAEKYSQPELKEKILGKITQDVKKYRGEILRLSAANFEELLRMDELNVQSEMEVVLLLKDWIAQNASQSASFLPLLNCIRFAALPPDFIVTEIASDNLFSGECSQAVMKGMSYHLLTNAKFDSPIASAYPRKSKASLFIVGTGGNGKENQSPLKFYKDNQWHYVDTAGFHQLDSITGL